MSDCGGGNDGSCQFRGSGNIKGGFIQGSDGWTNQSVGVNNGTGLMGVRKNCGESNDGSCQSGGGRTKAV